MPCLYLLQLIICQLLLATILLESLSMITNSYCTKLSKIQGKNKNLQAKYKPYAGKWIS